ncbi:thiamine-repressible acid phosphatase Pho4 [Schizosaccharomyces cryophilus OY26]|uniref:Thiamine-repressible acid phosphatase Pho4 n=1 Tax=Schizosaccharomyces cryophilus (strain OY26 / ATCC MYA-4695 / CBS 11777 / NBRC 106824 / NRRL Y48691) TaxID=653667 RepID=S9W0U4_SCHCR|nr:thiamine-repressible acid phosphatase Pho4 [Schizosaccharomyces cryophilus OY26]EPY51665.1 thiamine-repressible acid phosphatase Pho4 [Schizosaccharomyces cryophilus OY26]
MRLSSFSLWFLAFIIGSVSARFSDFESFKNTFNLQEHLGSLSIYHEPHFTGLSSAFPESCEIRQVHVLQRHGSRNPASDDGGSSAKSLVQMQEKLTNGSLPINYTKPDNPFQFIKSWVPVIELRNADKLSSSGRVELFKLGREVFTRYNMLFDADVYEINTAAQGRVVESAEWYSYGMFGNEIANKTKFVYLAEDETPGANSLSNYNSCPVYSDNNIDYKQVEEAHSIWENIFLVPIRNRLNPYFSNYNLTNDDVRSFFYLCAYELTLKDESGFCSLFTPSEIINFEYDYDLEFSLWGGPSSKWANVLGGPYIHNLAKSLRSVYNESNYQKTFFAFTHDGQILPIEAALGFFPDITPEHPLPLTYNPYTYSLKTSSFVPFAGNLITELFQCQDQKYYVRHLVNQQVFPLTDCGYGPSNSSDGMCELSAYLNSPVRSNSTYNGTDTFNAACQANPTNVTIVNLLSGK